MPHFETVSIGTPLDKVTVVAKVCLAEWNVSFLGISNIFAISFK
jgi:hypothetical protein